MRRVTDQHDAPETRAEPKALTWRDRLTSANNVWGLPVGIGGIVIGGLIAWVTWDASRVEVDPTMIVDPQRTVLVERDRIKDAPLKVVRRDGAPVETDVTAVRVYFWNDGRKPMLQDDVLEPFRLSVKAPAEILDFRVLQESRPQITRQVVERVENTTDQLAISFRVLERREGLTLQLVVAGDPNTPVLAQGVAIGARKVTTAESAPDKHWWSWFRGPGRVWLVVPLILIVAGFVWSTLKGERELKRWYKTVSTSLVQAEVALQRVKALEETRRRQLRKVATGVMAGVVLSLTLAGRPSDRGRNDARWVLDLVPTELLESD